MKKRRLLVPILACLLSVAVAVVGFGQIVFAHDNSENAAERGAPGKCGTTRRLTMWANASSTGSNHSMSVTITDPNQDSVTLYLHRSAYGCTSGAPGSKGMGAKDISMSVTNSLSVDYGGLKNKCLKFANTNVGHGQYADSKTTFAFTLRGLKNLSFGTTNATLSVFRYNGGSCTSSDNGDGSSDTEYISLTITRPLPPWSITPAVQISKNSTTSFGSTDVTAAPGDVIRWKHTLQAAGTGNPPNPTYWCWGDGDPTYSAFKFDDDCRSTPGNNTGYSTNLGVRGSATRYSGISNTHTNYTNASSVTTTIPANVVDGTKYCKFTKITSSHNNGSGGAAQSGQRCATARYNWLINLTSALAAKNASNGSVTTVSATVNAANNIKPSDTVTWTHKAQQLAPTKDGIGPTKTNAQSNFTLTHSNGWSGNATPNKITNFPSGKAASSSWETISDNDSKKIVQADVGKTLCSKVTANPGGGGLQPATARSSNDNTAAGTPTCIYIPYNYRLTPDTTITKPTNAGDRANVNYDDGYAFQASINNSGPTKTPDTAYWQAFTFVIPYNTNTTVTLPQNVVNPTPGSAAAANDKNVSNNTINAAYGLTGTIKYVKIGDKDNKGLCTGTYDANFNPGDIPAAKDFKVCDTPDLGSFAPGQPNYNASYDIDTLNLGDRLCFAAVVAPSWMDSTHQNNNYSYRSYSVPSCLTVSKSPQINLRGADSKSGAAQFGRTPVNQQGGFVGRQSSNPLRGSWSQYGLLSNGPVTNFGSTGYTLDTNLAKACKLIFANSTSSTRSDCTGATNGNLGVDGRIITLPKVAELTTMPSGATTLSGTTVSLAGLSGTYYTDRDVVITASALDKNQHIIVVALGSTVTIAGNIEAAGTYANLEEVPSLTVIADSIYVQGYGSTNVPVERIFGTYIAKDNFRTCTPRYKLNPDAWANPNNIALAGVTKDGTNPWDNGNSLCKNQLTVNGAVISKNRPFFQRTYGSGKTDASIPSEILNYSANLYLTPYALSHNGNNNDWRTADVRQLPARL